LKILAIRLKNLAALAGEQQIDFSAEPLASAGLFAITGPTGAGKSTLLDALCLALFGSTPRLEGSSSHSKVPDGGGELGSNDGRTLLRRGCASSYAEVDFIGVDGHGYRARWEVRRARDKASGKLQASQQSLYALDSGTLLAGAKKDFSEQLEQKLGLNMTQFTRAVLLAQSEFSAFLKAKDDERGSLLEKLTATDLYSRLGQESHATSKAAKEALEHLERQLDGLTPLDEEQRQQLEAQHQQQQANSQALRQQLETLERQQRWLQELHKRQQQEQQAQQALAEVEQARQAQAEIRQQLAHWRLLEPIRADLQRLAALPERLQNLHQQQHQQQQRLHQLQQEHREAEQQLKAAEQAHQQAKDAESAAQQPLKQAHLREDRLAHLREEQQRYAGDVQHSQAALQQTSQQWTQQQADYEQGQQQYQQLSAQLEGSQALAALSQHWAYQQSVLHKQIKHALERQALLKAAPALAERRAEAEATLLELEQQGTNLGQRLSQSSLAEQLSLLTQQLADLHQHAQHTEQLRQRWQDWQQQQAEWQQRQAEEQAQRQQQQALETDQQCLQQQREQAAHDLEQLQNLLTRQQLARSQSAEALRAQLQPDQPCPVCGSLEHPWQLAERLLSDLAQQDTQEVSQARQRLAELDRQLLERRDQLSRLMAEQQLNQQRLAELQNTLQAQQLAFQQYSGDNDWLEQPETERLTYLIRHLEQLQGRITATGQQQQQVLQRHSAQQGATAAINAQQQAQQRLESLTQQLDEGLQLLSESQRQHWLEQPEALFQQLSQAVAQRCQQQQQQAELHTGLQAQLSALEGLQQQQQQQQKTLEDQQQRQQQLSADQQQLQAELEDLLGKYPDTQAWQQHLEQSRTKAEQREKTQQQHCHALQRQYDQQQNALTHTEQQLKAAQQEQQQAQDSIRAWRTAHPEWDDAHISHLQALAPAQIQQWQQAVQQLDEHYSACAIRLEERQQQHLSHQAQGSPVDAQQLDTQLSETRQQLAEQEQQHIQIASQLAEDQRCRARCGALLEQIHIARAEYQRWAMLSELIGSADGAAFRKIAQAYNLDLLVQHANVQLRQLARRYRLQRGGSPLGLLVLDTEMGDECRSVHSLSGGETFLVSLALALGLASMASRTLHIESLFIDEGFGSLDPESLQVALDALDALQAQGRKVAVISHVQAMHERIAVQIQLQPQGNGQSRLSISGG